jgi:hypothetical protein
MKVKEDNERGSDQDLYHRHHRMQVEVEVEEAFGVVVLIIIVVLRLVIRDFSSSSVHPFNSGSNTILLLVIKHHHNNSRFMADHRLLNLFNRHHQ